MADKFFFSQFACWVTGVVWTVSLSNVLILVVSCNLDDPLFQFIYFLLCCQNTTPEEESEWVSCVPSYHQVRCRLCRRTQWLMSAEKLDRVKPAGMSLIYIAFIILALDEVVTALHLYWKNRVLNFNNHSVAMWPQRVFVLNVCFSHFAIHISMEVLSSGTSIANFLAVFSNPWCAQKSRVALVKNSCTVTPESLQKHQVGPRNLHLGLVFWIIWTGRPVGLTSGNSAVLEATQGSACLSLASGTSSPPQISQSVHYLLKGKAQRSPSQGWGRVSFPDPFALLSVIHNLLSFLHVLVPFAYLFIFTKLKTCINSFAPG